MITKLLFILCPGCGLALLLGGCGKPKSDPPVSVTPSTTVTNSPPVPIFESDFAAAKLLYDQGKFIEAKDAVRDLHPSGLKQHTKVAHFKADIAKAIHASRSNGEVGQNQ
jgi:hypothetical protein